MSSYNHPPNAPMDTRFTAFLESIRTWNVYAQSGEESICAAIFDRIKVTNKFCFECGAADSLFFSNTRFWIDQGWNAILVECDSADYRKLCEKFGDDSKVRIHQAFLSAQPQTAHEITLDDVLECHDAPMDLDLLVLDTDAKEYFILNSMVRFKPRVVIVEYNPDAPEMFIPELRGPGQAGHLAMRYVAEARGYDVIGRTPTNLICVRKDLSHLLMEETPEPISNGQKYQLFANNRWQDADGQVEVANDEELEAAQNGKLPVRALTSETRRVHIALAMSTPRIGYLDCLEQIIDLAYNAGMSRFRGQGVFWSHSLSRSIQQALEWRDEKTGAQFDYILSADYDTFATPANIQALATLLSQHPEIDAIVPLQVKRGQSLEVLAGWEGSRNLELELVPVEQAHFGFTLFRRQFFERLAKPWFREKADENGDWGEGRVDSDIGLWKNAKECGLSVFLAPRVVVGHGDEVVVFPRIENGKVEKVFMHVNEWLASKIAPEGIGVIQDMKTMEASRAAS